MQDISVRYIEKYSIAPPKEKIIINILEVDAYITLENDIYSIFLENQSFKLFPSSQNFSLTYYYVSDLHCLYIGHKNKLIVFDIASKRVVYEADLDGNVLKISFNNEGSLGCLLFDNMQLTLVTQEIEVVENFDLLNDNECINMSVNVGWGKKETQFHGSLGKAAAFADSEQNSLPSKEDDKSVYICWRIDDKYFSISYINDMGYRIIKTFNDKLQLYSINEETHGVQSNLCYLPKYLYFGSTRKSLSQKLEIVFFEVNGQRHKCYNLFEDKNELIQSYYVKQVLPNKTGSLIAILFLPTLDAADKLLKPFLRIYTFVNFIWSVRRHFPLENASHEMFWESKSGNLILAAGNADRFSFNFDEKKMQSLSLSSTGDVFLSVMDNQIKISDFGKAIIPPPLCSAVMTFDTGASIIDYTFVSCAQEKMIIIALLSDGTLHKCTLAMLNGEKGLDHSNGVKYEFRVGNKRNCVKLESVHKLENKTSTPINPMNMYHMQMVNEHTILFATNNGRGVGRMDITNDSISHISTDPLWQVKLDKERIISMKVVKLKTIDLIIATSQKNIFHVRNVTGEVEGEELLGVVSHECECMDLLNVNMGNLCQLSNHVLLLHSRSLSNLYMLQLDCDLGAENVAKVVLNNLTSYAIHQDFLALTLINKMFFVSREELVMINVTGDESKSKLVMNYLQYVIELDKEAKTGSQSSSMSPIYPIEGNSIIISCCDDYVILQMLRGNLERIHPKSLILKKIINLVLNRKDYLTAGLLMRKHRINLNLLYDISPSSFKANCKEIVAKFIDHSDDLLNLFISSLTDQDITISDYGQFFSTPKVNLTIHNKVDHVIEIILSHLEPLCQSDGEAKYIIPTLSCYSKPSSRRIDKALLLLANYQNTNETIYSMGLKHLQYYVDVFELFSYALSIYDLKLATSIARMTQLDPKYYVPMLKKLHAIYPEEKGAGENESLMYLQRAEIDIQMKKWCSAVDNLFRSSPTENWERILEITKSEQIFAHTFSKYLSVCKQKCRVIIENWTKPGNNRINCPSTYQTGILYKCAHSWKEASEIFHSLTKPDEYAHCMLQRLNADVNDPNHIDLSAESLSVKMMIAKLTDLKDFKSASMIADKILKDYVLAANCSIQEPCYSRANIYISLCPLEKRQELEEKLTLNLIKMHSQMVDLLKDKKAEFKKYVDRILELREEHAKAARNRRLAIQRGEIDPFSDDRMSEVSIFSTSTQKTNSTSNSTLATKKKLIKNAKPKKPMWNLNRGSRYEEVALIEELSKMYKFIDQESVSFNNASVDLYSNRLVEESKTILQSFNDLLNTLKSHINLIWDDVILNHVKPDPDDYAPARKFYNFREPFLCIPPAISVEKIDHMFFNDMSSSNQFQFKF